MNTPTTQAVEAKRAEPIRAQFDVFSVPDTQRERVASLMVAAGAIQAFDLQRRGKTYAAMSVFSGAFMGAGFMKDGKTSAGVATAVAGFLLPALVDSVVITTPTPRRRNRRRR